LTFHARGVKTVAVAKPKGPFYKALGLNIGKARKEAGYTQDDLAKTLKLSRTSITNIEKGKQPVQAHVLAELAQTLKTSVAALIPSKSASEEPEVKTRIAKLSESKQFWVTRVLGTYSEEEGHGSPKSPDKQQGDGATQVGKNNQTTRGR
jgi:transcriptional regulator with XRE-family HTH domain